jgi:hypothetical protein
MYVKIEVCSVGHAYFLSSEISPVTYYASSSMAKIEFDALKFKNR